PFAVHYVLVSGRLIVEVRRSTEQRGRLFKGQRFFDQFAAEPIELCTGRVRFAKCKSAVFRKPLRDPGIVKRLEPDRVSPPLISSLALEPLFGHVSRFGELPVRDERDARTRVEV